jgi:hypothetical protein
MPVLRAEPNDVMEVAVPSGSRLAGSISYALGFPTRDAVLLRLPLAYATIFT